MDIHINAISEEQLAELVSLIRYNHEETTSRLNALGATMATLTQTLNEIADRFPGLGTSILDLIAERDAAEAARVEAVNTLARERGEEEIEEAEQSAAADNLRQRFNDVAGLFEDKKLPDVEPLPSVEEPVIDEPVEEPTDVVVDEPTEEPSAPVEEPAVEEPTPDAEPAPADEPVEPAPADEAPADEQPSAPADEPVDDGSGAIEPSGDDAAAPVPAEDVPASEPGASENVSDDNDVDVVPNPGAEAENN